MNGLVPRCVTGQSLAEVVRRDDVSATSTAPVAEHGLLTHGKYVTSLGTTRDRVSCGSQLLGDRVAPVRDRRGHGDRRREVVAAPERHTDGVGVGARAAAREAPTAARSRQ